jgi:uncharacterized protein (DUF2336 family)
MAIAQQALIDDLEHVITDKNIGDRAAMLRRVTDLFVVTSGKLSDEQIALFDDVMGRLLEEIETSARAAFGHVLATVPDAPPRVVRMLALDDAIDVAGPILAHSGQVDELTLLEGAKTKSQAHLLAISRRKTLAETVTDVLVERGDQQVALSTAENPGAAFSEFGYSTIVQRSLSDDDLAACVWSRPEIPRQHLLKLFAEASEAVKLTLISKDPRQASSILEIVAQASHQIQTRAREKSAGYAVALAQVQSLHAGGGLGESQLADFACAGKFDETSIALSYICDLPIGLVERVFVDDRSEQIIVIAKAIGLAWETVKAMLLLQAKNKNGPKHKLDQHFETFARLQVGTAKKAIQFYRLRERATTPRAR